jgi:hypothetical protein
MAFIRLLTLAIMSLHCTQYSPTAMCNGSTLFSVTYKLNLYIYCRLLLDFKGRGMDQAVTTGHWTQRPGFSSKLPWVSTVYIIAPMLHTYLHLDDAISWRELSKQQCSFGSWEALERTALSRFFVFEVSDQWISNYISAEHWCFAD